ncbi:MAG TPA: glycosyltransferase family 9 protein [Candidatus Omnitrophota bacterium]|nr:glycosyltransferase family 9 protein [Candidatus Omnitrophota bacterium]
MRILFITSNRIGDAVLSTGLLAHLAETHPQARFTVACGAVAAPLFQPAPFVERVIPMVKQKRAGHWVKLWRATAGTWWHRVVDLRGSAMAWLVPTLHRHVLRSSWEEKHRLYHVASAIGAAEPLAPVLWNTPEQQAHAAALIGDGPVLAIGPTAHWPGKQWPADRFAQVADALTGPGGRLAGARVAVFGAPNERAAAQPLLDAIPAERRIDLIGAIDLATVHACIRRCALYVGNDSGLMHIAAASGTPTLGLFGPSSEVFYGPWGAHCAAVRGPRSFEDIVHTPAFDHTSDECLMLDLTVERVVAAADALLRLP